MKSIIFKIMFVASLMLTSLSAQSSLSKNTAEGIVMPTEVRYWDSSKAQNGYTFFAATGKTYLIDMEGYIINQWNLGTNPHLLDNGDILDATKADPSGFSGFRQLDWNGNTIWEYTEKRSNYFPHHDWTRIYNKKLGAYTTIYIANKNVPQAQALASGANPASSSYNDGQMDALVEVDMNGKIVWEWWFFDHVVQDFDSTKLHYVGAGKTIASYPGKININMTGKPLKKDWLHCNSVDYNDSLGHIVVNSVHGEFYIIDHDNTFIANDTAASIALAASTAGDFLYRFGDPARYNQGDPPSILADWTFSTTGNKQIGGSHDVHWIKSGLPGAGNIQIFNNGEYLFERVSQSYIFEVNPYYNSSKVNTGAYVNPPTAGYYIWIFPNKDAMKQNKLISNQVTKIYCSKNDQNFFSTIGGSEQRLVNGNLLICSDSQGHLFELANDSTIVWEYINPVTSEGIKQTIVDQYPMYNSVFRAYRYTSTSAPLVGKSLLRKSTITGKIPAYYKPDNLNSGVDIYKSGIPSQFELLQNYPNPFNPVTVINYHIPKSSNVSLKVYDCMGREVKTLVNEIKTAGYHQIQFNGSQLSSGIYYYQLLSENFKQTKKLLLVK